MTEDRIRENERTRRSQQGQAEPSICVIEDDPAVALLVRRVAERTGMRVVMSTSARQAMETIASENPRLVIADVNLPDLRGTDLVDELRQKGVRCPVLFISGDSSLATLDGSLQFAKASFLPKPFTASELSDAIWAALGQR